jgi:hypothetical protein
MRINEVAQLLCWQRDQIKQAIMPGIMCPGVQEIVKLQAVKLGTDYDVSDQELDFFINSFYQNEPKRQIPTNTRRQLLVESRHRCVVCQETSSLDFHHIIEFSELKHHDPTHMIVLCAVCHRRCTTGEIDVKAQYNYKAKIQSLFPLDENEFPARFSWENLSEIINEIHNSLDIKLPSTNSKNDFSLIEIEHKNQINRMGQNYFEFIRDNHQPYFGKIENFLRDPSNEKIAKLYYEMIDELNSKIAAGREKFESFEEILIQIRDTAKPKISDKRTLNILLSFTYFKCDIGRKT